MRKITFVLGLLLSAFSLNSYAAAGDLVTLPNGKYTIKNSANNGYCTSISTKIIREDNAANLTEAAIFTITYVDAKGAYTIQENGGKYVVTTDATANTSSVVDDITDLGDKAYWRIVENYGAGTGVDIISLATNNAAKSKSWNFSLNHSGANTQLGAWDADDNNSCWTLTQSTGNIAKDKLKIVLDNAKASVGTNPGCYPQSAVDAAQAVFDDEAGDYAAAKTALESAFILPVAGKYYQITSAYAAFENNQGVTKSVYVDGNNLKWKSTDRADMTSVWEIYNDGSKYVFKNYSTGTYISTYANSTFSLGEEANANTSFTWYAGGICNVGIGGGNFHAESHGQGAGVNGKVIQYGGGNAGASAWYLVEVDPNYEAAYGALENRLNELKVGKQFGNGLGQYTVTGMDQTAFEEALAAAKAVFDNNASTSAELTSALNALNTAVPGSVTVTLNVLVVGKYYRIENTAMDNYYLGLNGYTLNMKHNEVANETTGDNNPNIIWKYEQDGTNYYMKNVYAGLYPQNIPSGQNATAKIGTGKEKAFTYALYADATETSNAQWNIFFGGTQVNCEGSNGNKGNVNYWYGDNAHYYIYEVEAPADDFEGMCTDWYKAKAYTIPEEIEVDPAATVIISPSEFKAPSVVNAAIAALKANTTLNFVAADATKEKIQGLFGALTTPDEDMNKVKEYQDAMNNYGSLLSIAYKAPAAEYSTIILPINWADVDGWTVYSCANVGEDGVLELATPDKGDRKNRPFIIGLTEEAQGKTYQFIGYSEGAATDNRSQGLLTGVLAEETKVPAGSYILSKYNDKLGFYKVAEGADYNAAKYRCYLTLPAAEARFEALFFDGDTETGINSVTEAQSKQGGIYNIAGQRLSKLQKGLNIVNGKKIIVK